MKPADEGILPVGLRAIGKDIKQGGEGSILALQAIVKAKSDAQADTTVTSDYALLYVMNDAGDKVYYQYEKSGSYAF